MREQILLHLLNGDAFFLGGALIVGGASSAVFTSSRRIGRLGMAVLWLGVVLWFFSGTPQPPGLTCYLLGLLGILHLAILEPRLSQRWRVAVASCLLLSVSLLTLEEIRWRSMPSISNRPDSVTIVGDSLSAGGSGETVVWPKLLSDQCGLPVRNLAVAGAMLATARGQIAQLSPADKFVLVELGGNDLLGETPRQEFVEHLDAALTQLRHTPRQIVMFELPMLPHQVWMGSDLRRLAHLHGVALIPKHVLLEVILGTDATLDSLHLSDRGHQQLADVIASLIPTAESPPVEPLSR